MTDTVGKATYILEADARKVKDGVADAEKAIKASGASAEKAFKTQAGGALKGLDAQLQKMTRSGGITGAILGGVGIGAGLGVFSMLTRGIGMVTDALMDAVKAAAEDEKSQAQLNKTILNNVDAHADYTDVLKQATDEALALAFADDEVRASLNQLIPRTKDVTEAIRLNALAMDLARFKGMSLEAAATLVGKAYSGQVSALKRAGIALTETKDSTKALAELQEMVAGQAETYAGTAEGAYKTLDLTVQELSESIGYELLPYLKELAGFVRTDIIPNIDGMVHSLKDAVSWTSLLAATARMDFAAVLQEVQNLTDTEERIFTVPPKGTVKFWDPIIQATEGAADVLDPENPDGPAAALVRTTDKMMRSMTAVKEPWRADWKQLAAWAKDPFTPSRFEEWIEGRAKKAAHNAAKAARDGRPAAARRWQQIADAMSSPVMGALLDIGVGVDDAVRAITSVRRAGQLLANVAGSWFDVFGSGGIPDTGGGGRGGGGGRDRRPGDGPPTGRNASGTSNWRGGWTWVGERGPELMRLPQGTAIKSNEQSMQAMNGRIEVIVRDPDGGLARSGISGGDLGASIGRALADAARSSTATYTTPAR